MAVVSARGRTMSVHGPVIIPAYTGLREEREGWHVARTFVSCNVIGWTGMPETAVFMTLVADSVSLCTAVNYTM